MAITVAGLPRSDAATCGASRARQSSRARRSGSRPVAQRTIFLLVAAASLLLLVPRPATASSAAVDEHIKAGDARLAGGDLAEALNQYHAACDLDSKNYMSFFKRATVYLASGRLKQAVRDLDTVLELKPDFDNARSRRADLNTKLGNLQGAREDYNALGADKHTAQLAALGEAEALIKQGQDAAAQGNHQQAVDLFTAAIQTVGSDGELRMVRARSYMAIGQNGEAVGDILRATKLTSANTDAHFLLSKLYYSMGERKDALEQIRECVRLDADHKDCFDFYKILKKLNSLLEKAEEHKQHNRHAELLDVVGKLQKLGLQEPFYVKQLSVLECQSLVELRRTGEALTACNKAIELDGGNAELFVQRAHVREQQEDFESMVQDYQKASELDGENRNIKEGLARAQRLLKNSKKRDYYKILGVSRTANKKEITKAYRQLAQEWHPDRFESGEEKIKAERKFMDIADAKEVLTDPEKRKMFDNGEDPLDAEEERDRQSQRANPFRGGFNPFGGQGGFHFRFQ